MELGQLGMRVGGGRLARDHTDFVGLGIVRRDGCGRDVRRRMLLRIEGVRVGDMLLRVLLRAGVHPDERACSCYSVGLTIYRQPMTWPVAIRSLQKRKVGCLPNPAGQPGPGCGARRGRACHQIRCDARPSSVWTVHTPAPSGFRGIVQKPI